MTTATGSDRPRGPEGRYDRPSPVLQRLLAVFLALCVGGLVVALAVALWARATRDVVDGRVLGYDVVSEDMVRIDVEVSKRSGDRAYCIVRARGADGAEVGRDVVEVDAEGTPDERVRSEFDLATSSRAVTGELAGCSPQPISKDPNHDR